MKAKRVRGFLTSPLASAILALLAGAWEGFWLIGPPLGLNLNAAGREQYLSWGFVAFVVACATTFATQQSKIRSYQREFEPKAALVFEPGDVNCVQPGSVIREVQGAQIPCDEYPYAIGIVNLSAKAIGGCRLVLESSNPHNTSEHRWGRAMRVRNDPNPDSDGVFTLNPRDGKRPSVYVEVLREVVPRVDPSKAADVQLCYANTVRGQPNWFTDRSRNLLTFRLEGESIARSVPLRLAVAYDTERRRWTVEAPAR